jgi:hypothetical protein
MKETVTLGLVIMLFGCAAPQRTQPPARVAAKREIELAPRAAVETAVLDVAVHKLRLSRNLNSRGKPPCTSQADAQSLLRRNLHLVHSPSACAFAEHKGFFLFSGLGSAKPDDGLFEAGFAVKKGTAEIYRWDKE